MNVFNIFHYYKLTGFEISDILNIDKVLHFECNKKVLISGSY